MKPFIQITLNPSQGATVIGCLFVITLFVFVLLPGLSRAVDRHAGRLIAQARAITSFGESAIRSGGAFYRFSVYEKHLVVCLMMARSYSYEHVRLLQEKPVRHGKLLLDLDGTRVVLFGNAESLERLARALSERTTKA
jgi:hypothetical protein